MSHEQMRSPEKEIKYGNGNGNGNSNRDNGRGGGGGGGGGGGFKFNAQAAEFVPRSYSTTSSYSNPQVLSTGYFYPCVQYLQDGDHVVGTPSADWFYVSPSPPPSPRSSTTNGTTNNNHSNNNNNNNNSNDSSPVHTSNNSPRSHPNLSRSNSLNDDLQQKIVKQVRFNFVIYVYYRF